MTRRLFTTTLLAALWVGCAEGETMNPAKVSDLPADDEETDESGDEGEVAHEDVPDAGEEGEPEPGRILWLGEVDGDTMIHATLGPRVQTLYANGERYEIRLDADAQALYAQIVDEQGQVLELVRVGDRASIFYPGEQDALQFCFPFPFVPPIVANCFAPPCPWEQGWPGPQEPWPNCVEVSAEGDMVRVIGAIEGVPFGTQLMQGQAPVPMFAVPPTPAQAQALERAGAVGYDLQTLQPELAPLDFDCLDCSLFGSWIAGSGLHCAEEDQPACSDAYWGFHLYQQNCEQACFD